MCRQAARNQRRRTVRRASVQVCSVVVNTQGSVVVNTQGTEKVISKGTVVVNTEPWRVDNPAVPVSRLARVCGTSGTQRPRGVATTTWFIQINWLENTQVLQRRFMFCPRAHP